jgi:hypothetical protein
LWSPYASPLKTTSCGKLSLLAYLGTRQLLGIVNDQKLAPAKTTTAQSGTDSNQIITQVAN